MKTFIRVEYDRNYYGGDYSSVGDFFLVPDDVEDVEAAFEELSGVSSQHIVHYCEDELYDEHGDCVD